MYKDIKILYSEMCKLMKDYEVKPIIMQRFTELGTFELDVPSKQNEGNFL